MIERYGLEIHEMKQGEWISFVRECFTFVFGWDFAGPKRFDNDDEYRNEVPDIDSILDLDPLYLLSLGRKRLDKVDVDMERAFVYENYGYHDNTEAVDQANYNQVEELMDLARIWKSHGKRYGMAIGLPKKKPDAESLLGELKQIAAKKGIDHEIQAYYENVPVKDIVAGNKNAEYVDGPIYSFPNWIVRF